LRLRSQFEKKWFSQDLDSWFLTEPLNIRFQRPPASNGSYRPERPIQWAPRCGSYSSASYAGGEYFAGSIPGLSRCWIPPLVKAWIASTAEANTVISGFEYFIVFTSFLFWRSAYAAS
jgi:hypothetical protein